MKVTGTKDIQSIDRTQVPPKESRVQNAAATEERQAVDRVTIEAPQVAEVLTSARQRASANRTHRLKELETALKAGSYKPDVGQLAEKLLSAAEVDARLRAMMRG